MSQFENDETLDETTTEVVEETAEVEAVENDAENDAEAEASEPKAEDAATEQTDANDVLFDKANKAARLLRCRRAVMRREQEEKGGKASALVRALKLLQLKPKMEQKEMSELLGMRLRELDSMMAEAEKNDIVARVEPAEPDMRKVVIMADEDAIERAESLERKGEDLVPGLGEDDLAQLIALLDKVIDPLVALGLDEDETTRIHMAAHLHDIGKIAVPDSVLRKAGPLTRPEWEEMRRHPVTGYEILRKIDDFKEIAILVRHHHERWDGRGYPDGLSGHDIPPGSRVIAVADSIDAMMSSRSYRPAMTSAACRREIEKNSGIMYDPRVAAAALEHWDELVSRYAGADTPRTPYFDRLQLEHTRQAHDYLLTHQGSRITLPELAAKFHLSQSSLKICFKALYGVPVASYLRGLRMDTAARLLQESDLPVAEIAHRVGYEDPSRFAAAFRRHTGRRPTELRRVACPTAGSHTA